MSAPEEDNKSIVTRLRGSRRAMAVVLILACLSGVAVAQVGYDLTTFDRDTTGGSFTISPNSVEFSNVDSGQQEGVTAYVIGRDVLADDHPTVDFTLRIDGISNPGDHFAATQVGVEDGDAGEFVGVRITHDGDDRQTFLNIQATNGSFLTGDVNFGQSYYMTMELDEDAGEVTISGYDDPSRTNLLFENSGDYDASGSYDSLVAFRHNDVRSNINSISGEFSSFGVFTDQSSVSGEVRDEEGEDVGNATITARNSTGSEVASVTADEFGQYQMYLDNGTYNMTASKDGYFPDVRTVDVNGETTQNFRLRSHSTALRIDTAVFLEHGETDEYSVTYTGTNSSTGDETREDVTDAATVTSNDSSIVAVNAVEQEIVATSDTSVNNRTYLEAEYSTGGETYTTRQNVTVANETVDNLAILPPVNRFTASLAGGTDVNPNDKTIMLLIIGSAAGAAASLIATSFAGVAALTMVMILGWIMGMLGDGMAMVTIFIALFVGLNVAGNVDYTVRR